MALLHEGVALHRAGASAEAEQIYRRVLARQPDEPNALHLLGLLLCDRGETRDGLAHLDHVLAAHPRQARIQMNRATILARLGRLPEAVAGFDAALAAVPGMATAHMGRGHALLAMGHDTAALAGFTAAVAADPTSANAHYNRASALQAMGDPLAAIAGYTQALRADSGHGPARWNRRMCRLLTGDFSDWPLPWGDDLATPRRSFAVPRWDGAATLAGRRILLHIDQGFGDTLQFCRLAAPLAASGATVILEVPAALTRLLGTLSPGCTITAQGDTPPPVDLHCNLMDLPGCLGLTVSAIPAATPYLRADPVATARWRARLAALPGRKIGLVWGGSPRLDQKANALIDRRRSMPLDLLAPLAGVPGARFVSLQKGPPASQVAGVPALDLIDWTDELDDFADTAALVAALDLVISVDTSVAHLAGALGAPVWLLNRHDSCWRWLLDRDDSPWYPTLRQFRQTAPRDWEGVVARVRVALAAWAA